MHRHTHKEYIVVLSMFTFVCTHITRIFMLPFTALLLFSLIILYISHDLVQWLVYILLRISIDYWVKTGRALPAKIILIQVEFFSQHYGLVLFLSLQSWFWSVYHFAIKLFLTYLLLLLLLPLFSKLCLFKPYVFFVGKHTLFLMLPDC